MNCDYCGHVPKLGVEHPLKYHGPEHRKNSWHCESPECVKQCAECQDLVKAVCEVQGIPHEIDLSSMVDPRDAADPDFGYFETYISEELEAEFREKRKREDRHHGRNIFDSDNRWQGYAGEYAFKLWCEENGIDYVYHDEEGKKSPLDFTIGTWKIDVKTKKAKSYPLQKFHVDYNETQHQDNQIITHLVFASYLESERTIYLVAWNTKAGFTKVSRAYKKGEMMHYDENSTKGYPALYPMRSATILDNQSIRTLEAEVRSGARPENQDCGGSNPSPPGKLNNAPGYAELMARLKGGDPNGEAT